MDITDPEDQLARLARVGQPDPRDSRHTPVRTEMLRFLSPMRSLIFLLFLAELASIALSADLAFASSSQQPTSFAHFRSCQAAYCQELVDYFNQPIDWHVVVDVSGSYLRENKSTVGKIFSLISDLPLQDGDLLTIDEFSSEFFKGIPHQISSDLIQDIKDSRNKAMAEDFIGSLITRLDDKPPFPSDKTDIAGLFTVPSRGLPSYTDHSDHRPEKPRLTYYVVLTDGMNDPHGTGHHVSLFDTQDFLESLSSFASKDDRALLLVLDLGKQGLREAHTSAQKDWTLGMQRVRLQNVQQPQLPLYITRWGNRFFTDSIKRQIGRRKGIYPCLVTGKWESGRWPTVTGFPYPNTIPLPKCLNPEKEPLYSLEIPPDLVNGQKESVDLPLVLLASDSRKRDLLATFTSSSGKESTETDHKDGLEPRIHGPTISSLESTLDDAYGGWKPVSHSIPVPSFEDDPSFRTPWGLKLRFSDQREQSPFLFINLSDISLSAPTSAWESMGKRGKAFAFFALVFWGISLLLAWHYAERVRIFVTVHLADKKFPLRNPDQPPRNYDRGKFRIRHLKIKRGAAEDLEIKDVAREDIPDQSQVDEDYVAFDVIPIFNVVYHLIYLSSGGQRSRDGELIAFAGDTKNGESLQGEFLRAGFWTPNKWPWQKCDHQWRQPLIIQRNYMIYTPQETQWPLTTKEQCVVTTTLREDRFTWLSRIFSVALSSLAFSCSWAAFAKSLSRSLSTAWAALVASLVLALLFYVILHYPKAEWTWKNQYGLLADTGGTFVLHASLALGLYASFVAEDSTNRIIALVLLALACIFAALAYERLRDRLVSSRLRNRKPVNVWDFLLEIFLARLRS